MPGLRRHLPILIILLSAAPASAQDLPDPVVPRKVRPERVLAATDQAKLRPLTAIGPDGMLYIDWELAERLADGSIERPRTEMARMLLALRDGQWRHMPK